jgi:hypothetical protein
VLAGAGDRVFTRGRWRAAALGARRLAHALGVALVDATRGRRDLHQGRPDRVHTRGSLPRGFVG